MGREVCRAVDAEDDLALVAAVDPGYADQPVAEVAGIDGNDVVIAAGPEALLAAGVEVAVDFTQAEAARANLAFCAGHGIHAVVGTTGLGPADLDDLAAAFTRSNVVVAPNFAIGAVLMMRFAELAAPFFDTAEIVELHHDRKIDAPSGTAITTAERMAAASPDWAPDPTRTEAYPGARGAAGPAGIRVHSVRMQGMVAHQEVILGTAGQTLTIRHDSYDRTSFMPGVVRAVRAVGQRPGLTHGLDAILGL